MVERLFLIILTGKPTRPSQASGSDRMSCLIVRSRSHVIEDERLEALKSDGRSWSTALDEE